MNTPGKLEVTLKISELPLSTTTTAHGWKEFRVNCGDGRCITVALRPRMWARLQDAAGKYPQWVATISGQMGPVSRFGFALIAPNVQIFEKKPKKGTSPATDSVESDPEESA